MNSSATLTLKGSLLFLALFLGFALQADSARTKLDAAVAEFEDLSQSVASEKLPLARRVNQKRSEATTLRSATETFLLQQSGMRRQLEETQRQEQALSSQIDFIEALLVDHSISFESFLSASEDQRYRATIKTARDDVTATGTLESRLSFIDLSLQRIDDKLKVPHFDGEAIAPDGSIVLGKFVSVGPVSYFRSADGNSAGQAIAELNSLLPVVKSVPLLTPVEIKKFANAEQAFIPLDPTLGKAREIDQAQWTLADQIQKGGKVGYVIIAFAFAAASVSLIKTIQLLRINVPDTEDFQNFLSDLDSRNKNGSDSFIEGQTHCSLPLFKAVERHYHDTFDVIEERLLAHLGEAKRSFEKLLPILAIVAATAPLLGLLGTVVGMIKTFALINVYGSGEAKAFSAGISEALVTTEFGLVVAIPALILHGILKRYALQRLGELEDFASNLMVALRRERYKSSKNDA